MTQSIKQPIPIATAKSEAEECIKPPGRQRLRTLVRHKARTALAVLVALSIPTTTAVAMTLWVSHGGVSVSETVMKTVTILFFAGGLATTVAKCDPGLLVRVVGGALLLALTPLSFSGPLLLVTLALLVGLGVGHVAHALISPAKAAEAAARADELNPSCSTCHARSFCPFQPGGFADRYSPTAQVNATKEIA